MKASLVLLALPALLAGCLAGQPAAQEAPHGQVDGAVVDHLLRPYGNQTVTLMQLDRTDVTSPLGGFTFRGLPPGFYTLTTSLPDGTTAAQVVGVEAGKVTRVILQLLPVPPRLPYFVAHPYLSTGEDARADTECETCEFAVPIGADRPREVTFEALWDSAPLLGGEYDHLDIVITDGRGFALYEGRDLTSPVSVSIDGADIHPEATELRVEVLFADQFLPSAQEFTMSSVLTTYHLGTKADLFGA